MGWIYIVAAAILWAGGVLGVSEYRKRKRDALPRVLRPDDEVMAIGRPTEISIEFKNEQGVDPGKSADLVMKAEKVGSPITEKDIPEPEMERVSVSDITNNF